MEIEDMTLTDMVFEMQATRRDLDDAKQVVTDLQRKWDTLRKVAIPDKLEDMGLDSVKVKGVGTVSKRFDAYCTVKGGMAHELQIWLQERGDGDLIKPFVNPSSLKAYMKELFDEGEEIPEAYVNFSPYTKVVITK